jgi:N6-L-threonylcarbamoyladenine synthase
VVAGGVSANSFLKKKLTEECEKNNIKLFMPELKYCTDNAAMIGACAYFELMAGMKSADFSLTAKSTLPLKS